MRERSDVETPIFTRLADGQWPEHAINRMRRAEAVKTNGPTPAPSRMDRVIQREKTVSHIFGGMHDADEHNPDL